MISESDKTPQQNFVGGALWMIAMRWMMRLIGLVSTVILARLLTPADFGIVALALIVVGFLEILSWTAVDLALIREQKTSREHYDTAWTIQIIQGVIIAILLVIIAPYASDYFDEPLITSVVQLLALRVFIIGFQNIGVVNFRKNLDFATEFRFFFYKKIITFLFVVSLAFILKSYWALVLGMLAAAIIEVIISYRMQSYRPRISLARVDEIWSFSQWVLLSRIGYFLNQKTDQFIIGGITSTQVMGVYHMSTEMATMATSEVVMPIRRAFFPNFSKIAHMPEEFKNSILNVIGFLSVAIFAAGVGVSAISQDFVLLVLGEQWRESIPLIQILAIFGVAAALSSSMELLLLVTGRGDLSTIESWVQLAVLVPAVWYAAHFVGIYEVALARTLVASSFVFLMIYFLTKATPVKYLSILGVIWRPAIASVVMFFVIKKCHMQDMNIIFLRLVFDILIGAVSYFASLFLLWVISGRSPGVEQYIYFKVSTMIMNHRSLRKKSALD
jgi:O-antigen/teichoic acid export membrane protein